MATITAVRQALVDTLATIPDLNCYPYIPDSIVEPAAVVFPDTGTPSAMGRGNDTFIYRVRVAVSKADDRSGAERLDQYLASSGTYSIRAALVAARTLGLSGTDAVFAGWENYGDHIWNDIGYLGADVLVTVETRGDT
jgi:hypothetical protein